jgi:hypothetical protein
MNEIPALEERRSERVRRPVQRDGFEVGRTKGKAVKRSDQDFGGSGSRGKRR